MAKIEINRIFGEVKNRLSDFRRGCEFLGIFVKLVESRRYFKVE